MCVFARGYVDMCEVHMEARGIRSPIARVTHGCGTPDLGAGNRTWILQIDEPSSL